MMAFASVMGVGSLGASRALAQGVTYGPARTTSYVVAQPTAYAPVRPATYVAAQPMTYVAAQPATYAVQPVAYVAAQPTTYAATPAATYAAPAATGGDAYGFTAWLNGVRAQYGLPAVGYDPNLEGWAAANNAQQAARGIGHFVMGPARRQNSAMGGYGSIGAMWLNSPAHRAALLDPSITRIGLAGNGSYWTFNAY